MENAVGDSRFPVRFAGRLRPAQRDAVRAARRDLDAGRKRIHIVAPPGSGKTVLGLYLWSELIQRPALVLSPNSAIQAQWAARMSLFQFGDRAGGYVRMFLENAAESDAVVFATSLAEALGPLKNPRYVIPRFADEIRDTWLSKILPEVLSRYFRKRHRGMAALHAVPSALAGKKKLAAIYALHWNRHVSPGLPLYAHRGEGEHLLREARQKGCVPQSGIHHKEVFV